MSILTRNINLKLDPNFKPAILYIQEYKKQVLASNNYDEISIVIERMDGFSEAYDTVIFGKEENRTSDNLFYLERLIKTLLWTYGGFKITFVGPKYLYEDIKEIFINGSRTFDSKFMERIYEQPFMVLYSETKPLIKVGDQPIGKNLDGNRIGFDAGGSDMKVSAVINGEAVFSEEVVWLPKLNSDPLYHKENIRKAIKKALEHMPRVDAIGVSSAGVYINNQAKVASLFILVPDNEFNEHIKNIYIDVAKELGVPLEVANDGDVTALAGSMSMGVNKLLGIAMGTSEAVGYVNGKGNIAGWLNELAFAPVDFQSDGPLDEWSLDIGVGCKYFSQDAVIRLAESAGIEFDSNLTLAEKLKQVQSLPTDSETYQEIYKTIGTYLGFTLAYYSEFYDIENILLLGRVMSGIGGDIIVKVTEETLANNFPELKNKITIHLPNEMFRRVGQSVAAASLPKIK